MLGLCVVGSLIAGTYGILHDQVTYSIGPEYFTRFKFEQFAWADWGAGKSWPSAKRWQGSILVV